MSLFNFKKAGLLALVVMFLAESLYAQSQQITLPSARIEVSRAIEAVERQTGLTVSYNSRLLNAAAPVIFTAAELPLERLLDQMLAGKGLAHLRRGDYIIIHPDFRPNPTSTPLADDYVSGVPNAPTDPLPRPEVASTSFPAPVVRRVPAPGPDTSLYRSDYRSLDRFTHAPNYLPSLAVKTDPLYGVGTLTPNLALETRLDTRLSLALSGSYNPWNRVGTLADNDKLVHWVVRPELRYWFCEVFERDFVSVSPFYNQFNVGGRDIPFVGFEKMYRYEGNAVGIGVNYGYSLPLGPRWNVELSVGAGVALMKYDRFDCTLCSGVLDTQQKTYFGPTRLVVNLVYLIR